MEIETYFCQYETDHRFVNGEYRHEIPRHKTINDYDKGHSETGCVTFPIVVTTDHAQSSHGQPVVLDSDGRAYGPADLSGHIQLYKRQAGHIDKIESAGWELPRNMGSGEVALLDGDDYDATDNIENGQPIPNAPFPNARLVAF